MAERFTLPVPPTDPPTVAPDAPVFWLQQNGGNTIYLMGCPANAPDNYYYLMAIEVKDGEAEFGTIGGVRLPHIPTESDGFRRILITRR